jgi:hypothetical protein
VSETALFACQGGRGPQWQLGPLPPPRGTVTLLGWSESPARPDGGVPPAIAGVLARAFTASARTTFPSSLAYPSAGSSWSEIGGDHVRLLTNKGIGSRIAAKLRGTPPNITLVSTRRPDTAIRLFDDEGFPWWRQAQVGLLSKPDAPPTGIDEPQLLALFDDEWTTHAASLAADGVEGVVRPGVDGDVAGVWTLSEAFEQALLSALANEARSGGIGWTIVSEDAFASKVAGEQPLG